MKTKICGNCKEEKELTQFNKNKDGKFGRHSSCKSCKKKRSESYYKRNREKIIEKTTYKNLSENRKKKRREYLKKYRKTQSAKNTRNKRRRNRQKTDPLYNLKSRLRRRTLRAFEHSRWNKKSTNKEMLGCSYKEAFNHIESQFKDGMSWENRSEWHIDHIIPLASAKTEEELIKLCHYTNLQPLWAKENLKKGSKIIKK